MFFFRENYVFKCDSPLLYICMCVSPQQPVKEVLPLPRHPTSLPVASSSSSPSTLTPAAVSKKLSPGSIQHVQVASSGDQQTLHILYGCDLIHNTGSQLILFMYLLMGLV